MTLSGTESVSNSYQSFDTSNYNSSKLFSFLVPRIKDTVPFSWLLGNSSSNELTDNLWDGDVGLVIYVFDMKPGIRYKVHYHFMSTCIIVVHYRLLLIKMT